MILAYAPIESVGRVNMYSSSTSIARGGQRIILLDQLARLEMPTMIVWGEDDRICPAMQTAEHARASTISHLSCVLLPWQ